MPLHTREGDGVHPCVLPNAHMVCACALHTHRDDVADHDQWAKHFGCTRVLHELEVAHDTTAVEVKLQGEGPWTLTGQAIKRTAPAAESSARTGSATVGSTATASAEQGQQGMMAHLGRQLAATAMAVAAAPVEARMRM